MYRYFGTLGLSSLSLSLVHRRRALLHNSPRSPIIPSQHPSRIPSNIPLRTLPTRSGHDNDGASTSLLSSHQGDGAHYRDLDPADPRRDSYSSEGSSWTDTGDIGEQKGEDDDPVRLQLSNDIEDELLAGVQHRSRRSHKKVRIQDPSPGRSRSPKVVIDKEAIEIPHCVRPPPTRSDRCLGFIMAGRTGAATGLTGRALL